jgi:hypothetical protein
MIVAMRIETIVFCSAGHPLSAALRNLFFTQSREQRSFGRFDLCERHFPHFKNNMEPLTAGHSLINVDLFSCALLWIHEIFHSRA